MTVSRFLGRQIEVRFQLLNVKSKSPFRDNNLSDLESRSNTFLGPGPQVVSLAAPLIHIPGSSLGKTVYRTDSTVLLTYKRAAHGGNDLNLLRSRKNFKTQYLVTF